MTTDEAARLHLYEQDVAAHQGAALGSGTSAAVRTGS